MSCGSWLQNTNPNPKPNSYLEMERVLSSKKMASSLISIDQEDCKLLTFDQWTRFYLYICVFQSTST